MHEPDHFTRAKFVRFVRFLSTLPPPILMPYRFTPSTGLPITVALTQILKQLDNAASRATRRASTNPGSQRMIEEYLSVA